MRQTGEARLARLFHLPLCAVALLAIAGSANALTGSLDLTSDAPVTLTGTLAVGLQEGSLVRHDPHAEGDQLLRDATGRLTVWGWNATRVGVAHPLGRLDVANQIDDAQAQTYHLTQTDLRVALRREAVAFRILPEDDASLRVRSDVRETTLPGFLGAPVASSMNDGLSPYRRADELAWRWEPGWLFYGRHDLSTWPQPWVHLEDPVAELEGSFRIQILGGNLSFTDDAGRTHTIRLGVWSDGGPSLAPGQTSRVETIRWAIFEGTLAASEVPLRGVWGGATPAPEWTFDGRMAWRDATGTVVAGGAQRHVVNEDVALDGRLDLRIDGGTFGTSYAGSGDLSAALLRGEDVLAARPQVSSATQASVALALAGLAGVAFALYTRVRGGKPLDHPMRRAIYECVVANPGIYKRELQRAVGCGWGAFQFHFRALERPGYLRTQAQGKYLLVFAGHVRPTQTTAVVPNPLARRIYDAIPEGRPVLLHDLRQEMGISYQLLKYHLRGLESRGLVQRVEAPSRAVSITRRPIAVTVPVIAPPERAPPTQSPEP